ncbi:MAG: DNA translocase FtsK 4TM domain-containing protein, partial [Candidatus Eisenbacteria bacterium]
MKGEGRGTKNGAVRVDRERKILGILLLSLGLLVAIGLVQHASASSGDFRRFNHALSRGLLGFFGFGSWLVPLFLLRVGWNRLTGGALRALIRSVVLCGSILLTFSLLVFSTRIFGSSAGSLGGSLGAALFEGTNRYFGSIGSTLIGITFFLVVLTALYDIAVPRFHPPDLGARIFRLPSLLADAAAGASGAVRSRLRRPEPPDDIFAEGPPRRRKKEKMPQETSPATAAGEKAVGEAEERAAPEESPARGESETGAPADEGPVIHKPASQEGTQEKAERKRRARRGEKEFLFPPITLLRDPPENEPGVEEAYLRQQSARLEEALAHFGVRARVAEVHPGPVITRFELEPAPGVKVQQIAG